MDYENHFIRNPYVHEIPMKIPSCEKYMKST